MRELLITIATFVINVDSKDRQTQSSFSSMNLSNIYRVIQFVLFVGGFIFAYYKFFRKNLARKEVINSEFADWKYKQILKHDKITNSYTKQQVEIIAHKIVFEKQRKIIIQSSNKSSSYAVSVNIQTCVQESEYIYQITMKGNDPKGKSKIKGYISFQGKKMTIILEQTYEIKIRNTKHFPVKFLQGIQTEQNKIEGQWWIEGQKGTKGQYTGHWIFQY